MTLTMSSFVTSLLTLIPFRLNIWFSEMSWILSMFFWRVSIASDIKGILLIMAVSVSFKKLFTALYIEYFLSWDFFILRKFMLTN